MNSTYLAFLRGHLDYMISRLFAAEESERFDLIKDINRVRGVLNEQEKMALIVYDLNLNKE